MVFSLCNKDEAVFGCVTFITACVAIFDTNIILISLHYSQSCIHKGDINVSIPQLFVKLAFNKSCLVLSSLCQTTMNLHFKEGTVGIIPRHFLPRGNCKEDGYWISETLYLKGCPYTSGLDCSGKPVPWGEGGRGSKKLLVWCQTPRNEEVI